jgi:hypothetical protein
LRAFDGGQHPRDAIAAVKFLLTHRAPRVVSPEEAAWEAERALMTEAEIDAAIAKLEAEISELMTIGGEPQVTPGPDPDVASGTEAEREPSQSRDPLIAECLDVLKRIGDGLDPRASGKDRLRAAELREEYVAATSGRDPIREEIESWSMEELESFLDFAAEELESTTDQEERSCN